MCPNHHYCEDLFFLSKVFRLCDHIPHDNLWSKCDDMVQTSLYKHL